MEFATQKHCEKALTATTIILAAMFVIYATQPQPQPNEVFFPLVAPNLLVLELSNIYTNSELEQDLSLSFSLESR